MKLDLFALHHDEYTVTRRPRLVNVGPALYLVIDGEGEPSGELFNQRLAVLYAVAYTLKMARLRIGRDYALGRIEVVIDQSPNDGAQWRLLMRTPDFISPEEVMCAAETLRDRGYGPLVDEVRLESITEGPCIQALHIGPTDSASETMDRVRSFAAGEGLEFRGPHHRIYLSDPRRVSPDRLRTILREPVK
jgi:hypothetical protein